MSRTLKFGLSAALIAVIVLAGCSLPGSGSGGTGRLASPSGPCANPLYPVAPGITWNYQISGSTNDSFVRSINTVSDGGFEDQDVHEDGAIRTGEWNCDAGTLTALDPVGSLSATVQRDAQLTEFHTTTQSGVTLPASIEAGTAWTQSVGVAGTTISNGVSADATNDTSLSCTGVGTENVTVPAGSFDAMRVTCQNSIVITITTAGITITVPEMDFTSDSWYAPGVGLVEVVTTGGGLDSTMVLTSYSMP
jgi:hypothetical protein